MINKVKPAVDLSWPDLELARRAGGVGAAARLVQLNNNETTNAAQIGPAAIVTARSLALTVTPSGSGKVRVTAMISGTHSVPGGAFTVQLIRDPVASTGAPGGVPIGATATIDSGAAGHFFGKLTWIDTVAPGSTHTWGLSASAAAGTLTVPVNSSSNILQEVA